MAGVFPTLRASALVVLVGSSFEFVREPAACGVEGELGVTAQ
jgi:hypothetical protein